MVDHFPYAAERARAAIAAGADASASADTGETLLMRAILSLGYGPHESLVSVLLDAGAEINVQDDYGMSPMAYVMLMDRTDRELVRALIDHGWEPRSDGERLAVELVFADAEKVDRMLHAGLDPSEPLYMEATALMIAARHNPDLEVIRRLVEAGGDVDAQRNWSHPRLRKPLPDTPPLIALRSNPNPEVIAFLFEASQDPRAPLVEVFPERSLLMTAASAGQSIEVMEWLIERGEDPDHRDEQGWNVVIYALPRDDPAIIEFLVRSGAQSHAGDWPSLYYAVWVCHAPMIEKLLELGADDHPLFSWDEVLLNYARHGRDPAVLDILLRNGVDLNARSGRIETVLITAMANPHLDVVPGIIAACMEAGIDMSATDHFGLTAMHHIGDRAHLLGPLLLKAGIDINTRGNRGETALMRVSGGGDDNLLGDRAAAVRWMLANGADQFARAEDGSTALTFAVADLFDERTVRVLIESGLDLNHKVDGGYTAMHKLVRGWGWYRYFAPTVATLIELGADPNTVSDHGNTPLHDAIREGVPEWVLALLDGGADGTVRNRDGLLPIDLARRFMDDERVLTRLEEAMR